MLKTSEILDEKDKRLRLVSEEVTFPLAKEDKEKGPVRKIAQGKKSMI